MPAHKIGDEQLMKAYCHFYLHQAGSYNWEMQVNLCQYFPF